MGDNAETRRQLTDSQLRALRIIRDNRIEMPRQFARLMWPDSDGWKTMTKCGNYGATRGGGMNLAGGAYLGKLRQWGFINWRNRLSLLGREVLKETEEQLKIGNK